MTTRETELPISEEPHAERVPRHVRSEKLNESRLFSSAKQRAPDVGEKLHRLAANRAPTFSWPPRRT